MWQRCWFSSVIVFALVVLVFCLRCKPAQFHHNICQLCPAFLLMQICYFPLLLLLFHCCNWQGVSTIWRRDSSKSVLRVPSCSLPGMATFVSAGKPNFRVTSTRDPAPLISYHTDGWTPAYSQNSLASAATSHTHEMRASVIMKTSDVTSSWPLTPDEGVLSLLSGHRNDRDCLFSSGPGGAKRGRVSKPLIL